MLKKPVIYTVVDKHPVQMREFLSRPEVYEDICQSETPLCCEFHVIFFGVQETLTSNDFIVKYELIRLNHKDKDIDAIQQFYLKDSYNICWLCAPPGYGGKNIN